MNQTWKYKSYLRDIQMIYLFNLSLAWQYTCCFTFHCLHFNSYFNWISILAKYIHIQFITLQYLCCNSFTFSFITATWLKIHYLLLAFTYIHHWSIKTYKILLDPVFLKSFFHSLSWMNQLKSSLSVTFHNSSLHKTLCSYLPTRIPFRSHPSIFGAITNAILHILRINSILQPISKEN